MGTVRSCMDSLEPQTKMTNSSGAGRLTLAAVVLAAGAIIAAAVFGAFFHSSRASRDTVQVVGAASQRFTSDIVKWRLSLARQVDAGALGEGYALLRDDVVRVRGQLRDAGVPDSAVSVQPVSANPMYSQSGTITSYQVVQGVVVVSSDVEAVERWAFDPGALLGGGVVLQGSQLEYFYSGLESLKHQLLAAATTDARLRADEIAGSAERDVGSIVSARAGVFQINEPYANEVSAYGMYNTGTRQKEITVTVHSTFVLD